MNLHKNIEVNDSITRLLYRAPYCDILMAARFNGCIPQKSIEAALSKMKTKYPLLSAGILQDENGGIVYAFDSDKELPVTVFENKAENDWLELAWEEQKVPFDLQQGPLIKFLLVYTAETTDLVVICHHCICDGLSLAYLIKDIAAILEKPDIETQPLPVPPTITNDNLSVGLPMGISGHVLKVFAKFLNRAWNKNKVIFDEQDYERSYKEYWKTKNIGLIPFNLPKSTTAALIEKCRAKNVSVNSALTTAFSLAQHELQGNRKPYLKKALLAMNIRHLFKTHPGENFGLLAVGNEITLPSGKDGFWNIANRFNTETKKMLANPKKSLALIAPLGYIEPTLIDAIYFIKSGALENKAAERLRNIVLTKTGKPKRSMDITNLGIVKDFNAILKNVFFVPILSGNYEKTLGIVTINGEINIVVMHDHSVISQETMELFKQNILQIIDNAIH